MKRYLMKESLTPLNSEKCKLTPRSKIALIELPKLHKQWLMQLPNRNDFLKHGFQQTGVKPTRNLYTSCTSVILSTCYLKSKVSITKYPPLSTVTMKECSKWPTFMEGELMAVSASVVALCFSEVVLYHTLPSSSSSSSIS